MSATCLRIEAVDTVSFRGNTGFSNGGTVGRSMMPPWPSTLSGALRSWILASSGALDALRASDKVPAGPVRDALGERPAEGGGPFRVTDVGLLHAGRCGFPVPADLEVREDAETGDLVATRLVPFAPAGVGARTGAPLPMVPVLKSAKPAKPVRDAWISSEGLRAHLEGQEVSGEHLVRSSRLWRSEFRVGVALDPILRSAEEGRLFTTERLRLVHEAQQGTRWDDVELFVRVVGAGDTLGDRPFWLRLGGDGSLGRAHLLEEDLPGAPWAYAPADARAFRIVMATPGLFRGGWLPAEQRDGKAPLIEIDGLKAKILCAAVPRGGAVSGWDVRNHKPKPLVRSVPAGAVYWCKVVEGSVSALAKARDEGLWEREEAGRIAGWRARRAEGFNSFWLGRWDDPPPDL